MSRTALPGRRARWRSATAGVFIAAASFTTVACGGDEAEDEGVVEEEVVEEDGEVLEEDE